MGREEWCGKQKEFTLRFGKYNVTKAMKAGRARHAKLEEEVSKKVKFQKESVEYAWVVKFMNFIICANQLSLKGLTREIPLICLVNDIWMVGVIDEIRLPVMETVRNPSLVDTKTRSKATLPAEPQKRNGRLQLMCYKYLWDTMVTDDFPINDFFNYFGLNPQYILSKKIQEHAANLGFNAKMLGDLVMLFKSTCRTLPPAHDQLLLRMDARSARLCVTILNMNFKKITPCWESIISHMTLIGSRVRLVAFLSSGRENETPTTFRRRNVGNAGPVLSPQFVLQTPPPVVKHQKLERKQQHLGSICFQKFVSEYEATLHRRGDYIRIHGSLITISITGGRSDGYDSLTWSKIIYNCMYNTALL
ncbi:Exonuclease V [Macleaya cordata]|uniref:Exonuclease V n=1 Tax=Macleaya cordata TaxID=56857 RepID=A0A200QHB9_MACCD|nr:Exonuclease V [Macleaya cordata]